MPQDQDTTPHNFFLVPIGRNVGFTSISLGLIQALMRSGAKTGFVKPISQPSEPDRRYNLSPFFARTMSRIDVPEPIPFSRAEELLRAGDVSTLMEEVVSIVNSAAKKYDAVVVEGLVPINENPMAYWLNWEMVRCLSVFLVPVVAGVRQTAEEIHESLGIVKRQYLEQEGLSFGGLIINKLPSEEAGVKLCADLARIDPELPILGVIPYEEQLNAPRMIDVARQLGFSIEREGNIKNARLREIVMAAQSVEKVIDRLKPGALIITGGERSDVVLAAYLASNSGAPLAGLLLTCDSHLPEQINRLIPESPRSNLTILNTKDDSFLTAARLSRFRPHVTAEDTERMQKLMDYIAEHISTDMLRKIVDVKRQMRLTPPAFRYQMMQSAREANKRIVLPEGEEPRTIHAAIICHEKKIARCVLLGDPQRIRTGAEIQGLTFPDDLEILEPEKVREQYVAQLVELRKAKGMTPEVAAAQLEDPIVLGTVMLTMDHVDGLVSGAVHTTASTVRPALQLIKTAPGQSIVSSVFFMLMPDQVLVYGDCAINPDPTAEELAQIAIQSADSAEAFGISPRVAMISYSTGTSGVGADVDKVRLATELVKKARPDILIDGPLQYDAASVLSVGRQKAPDSQVAGRANVFVFPDLNTGNTTYKAVQRSANVVSVGPMLQGLRKPVNDLSRGALVDDIVYTIALTAIQAQQGKK